MAGSNTAAPSTAGTNKIHHQSGVLPSANDASLSVSQPGPRLFSTIGARCNSAGGVNVFKLVVASAICFQQSNVNEMGNASASGAANPESFRGWHRATAIDFDS